MRILHLRGAFTDVLDSGHHDTTGAELIDSPDGERATAATIAGTASSPSTRASPARVPV